MTPPVGAGVRHALDLRERDAVDVDGVECAEADVVDFVILPAVAPRAVYAVQGMIRVLNGYVQPAWLPPVDVSFALNVRATANSGAILGVDTEEGDGVTDWLTRTHGVISYDGLVRANAEPSGAFVVRLTTKAYTGRRAAEDFDWPLTRYAVGSKYLRNSYAYTRRLE